MTGLCLDASAPLPAQLALCAPQERVRLDPPLFGDVRGQSAFIGSLKGRSVTLPLCYADSRRGDELGGVPAKDVGAWAASAAVLASLCSSAGLDVTYEIFNEPNKPGFWATPDPIAYAALCQAAIPAIRSKHPGAKVLVGSLADVSDPGPAGDAAQAYLKAFMAAGGHVGADGLAAHFYSGSAPLRLAIYRGLTRIKRAGWSGAVACTEFGYKLGEAPAVPLSSGGVDVLNLPSLDSLTLWQLGGTLASKAVPSFVGARRYEAKGQASVRVKGEMPAGLYEILATVRSDDYQECRFGIGEDLPVLVGPEWRTIRVVVPNNPAADPKARTKLTLTFWKPIEIRCVAVYPYSGSLDEAKTLGRLSELRSAADVAKEFDLLDLFVYSLCSTDGYGLGAPPSTSLMDRAGSLALTV